MHDVESAENTVDPEIEESGESSGTAVARARRSRGLSLGIRPKLFLAFGAIAALTLVASAVGIFVVSLLVADHAQVVDLPAAELATEAAAATSAIVIASRIEEGMYVVSSA